MPARGASDRPFGDGAFFRNLETQTCAHAPFSNPDNRRRFSKNFSVDLRFIIASGQKVWEPKAVARAEELGEQVDLLKRRSNVSPTQAQREYSQTPILADYSGEKQVLAASRRARAQSRSDGARNRNRNQP